MGVPVQFNKRSNTATIGNESMVFHCHHYNCALQKTIEEGMGDDAPQILQESARETVRAQLGALSDGLDAQGIKRLAEQVFAELGFGMLDLKGVSDDGGTVIVEASHYAMGWCAKYGERTIPVCHFVSGFVAAAVGLAHGVDLSRITVRESRCLATGEQNCQFDVEVG